MSYDGDVIEKPVANRGIVTEDACFALTIIMTILMIITGLPSISAYYVDPVPAIMTLGLTALTLAILYLAMILKKQRTSP